MSFLKFMARTLAGALGLVKLAEEEPSRLHTHRRGVSGGLMNIVIEYCVA